MTVTENRSPAEGNQDRGPASDHEGAGHDLDLTLGFDRCDCIEAVAWRWLCQSGHVLDLIAEWSEWDRRRVASETSQQLSAAGRWSGGTSYAELRRRRRLTSVHPCHICGESVEIVHPMPKAWFDALPRLDFVRCPSHAEAA
jgi:hypothetical protein